MFRNQYKTKETRLTNDRTLQHFPNALYPASWDDIVKCVIVNAGFVSAITRRVNVHTNSEHFCQCRDATSSVKRRKVDIEHRAFNPACKKKYFFTERFGQAQCLICLNTVPVLKEFTMRRHWVEEHRASNFASMSSEERKYAIDRLSGNLQKTTSFFRKQTDEADTILLASYEISRILARGMKPFSNGDFIEECLVAVVDFSSTHDGPLP